MADDYAIAITIDPGTAVPTAQRVATELGKAEQAGARAGAAISSGMRDAVSSAERARDQFGRFIGGAKQGSSAADGVARSSNGLARAFDGVAAAVQREQTMLDKINGPLKRYEQNLQTLDSLLDRNRISTQQYADEVSKLNRQLEKGSGIKPPAAPKAATKAPTGGESGGLAGLGQAASTLGLAVGVREVLSMAGSYQELTNKMKVVADTGESVSSVMGKIQASADRTRTGLGSATEAYQRLRGATREMGMGSEDLLRVTERMSKAIKVSGASAAEASATQIQLAQALASGRLQGDEFRSVAENAPYVMQILAQSLGVTTGKLREMAGQGKLTSAVVVGAFEKMGRTIDTDFAKTTPTINEQFQVLADKTMLVVGKLFEASGTFQVLGGVLGVVGDLLGVVGDLAGALKGAFDSALDALGPFGDGLRAVLNPLGLIRDGMSAVMAAGEALGEAWADDASLRAARAYNSQIDALKRLEQEEIKLERASKALNAARATGASDAIAPALDLERAKAQSAFAVEMKRMYGIDIPAAYDATLQKGTALADAIKKIQDQRALDEQAEAAKRAEVAMTGFNAQIDANAKHWRSVRDELTDVNGALAKIAADRAAMAKLKGVDGAIEMQGKGRQDALDVTRQELALTRQKRDLTDSLANSEYAYGATVERIRKATNEHKDDLENVNGAFRDGKITVKEYSEELKRLGVEEDRATKLLKELRQPTLDWSSTITALNTLLKAGRIDLQQYNTELAKLASSNPVRTGELQRGGGLTGGWTVSGRRGESGKKLRPEEFAIGYDEFTADQAKKMIDGRSPQALGAMGIETDIDTSWADKLIEKANAAGGVLEDASVKTARWNKELEMLQRQAQDDGFSRAWAKIRSDITDTAGALESTLTNAFKGAEDALVSFVTTGEFGFKKMVDSMLADLTRLLIKQALAGIIGGIGGGTASALGTGATQAFSGLFGSAPGYATGGEGRIGGSGGPDSKLFIARVTPGEHFRFTPPGQSPPPAPTSTPAPVVQIVPSMNEGAIEGFMERRGEQYHLAFDRRNRRAVRGSTTGR